MLVRLGLLGGASIAAQEAPLYHERYRPQVHFSPARHWTNDPNGLVFFEGEYHLFYQYNPLGDVWGHMSWGHAVSTDLLHWKELPVALHEAHGVMIYTGSVVVDEHNTSGLCLGGKPCLVAIYTGASKDLQVQDLAYSNDRGRTWTKFSGNPVLDLHLKEFRDPSVQWDEMRHRWLMLVAVPLEHKVRLYTSADLKHWSPLSEFGPEGITSGDWECPTLLQVPGVAGAESAWVLKVGLNPGAPQGGSGEQYFLGGFDGTTFHATSTGLTNYGKDDYCAIPFNGLPAGERPILIGWMSNWQYAVKMPTKPWRGQMSLPRRLSVRDGVLVQEPVVEPLRLGEAKVQEVSLNGSRTVLLGQLETPVELEVTFDDAAAEAAGIRLRFDEQHSLEVRFDVAKREVVMDRTHAGGAIGAGFPAITKAPMQAPGPRRMRLVIDRSSVELFAQDGAVAMTDLVYPAGQTVSLELFGKGARKLKARTRQWALGSVWP